MCRYVINKHTTYITDAMMKQSQSILIYVIQVTQQLTNSIQHSPASEVIVPELVKIFPALNGARISLPHSKQHTTCPCPEPDQSILRCPFHSLKICFNIIFQSTHRSAKWSLSFKFPHQDPVCTFLLPHACLIPRTSHYS
jgi:hypothetical protein